MNTKHFSKRLLQALNILLLCGLLAAIAGPLPIYNTAINSREPEEIFNDLRRSVVPRANALVPNPSSQDYSSLVSGNLFGVNNSEPVQVSDAVPEPDVEEYVFPELRLMGTIAGGGSIARALIKTPDGNSSLYKVGDYVDGVMLEDIGPRSVRFVHDSGNYELGIEFARVETARAASETPPRAAPAGAQASPQVVIVGRTGEVTGSSAPARASSAPGSDEEARARRAEAIRVRRERMLQSMEPEERERMLERIRRAEEAAEQRRRESERQNR